MSQGWRGRHKNGSRRPPVGSGGQKTRRGGRSAHESPDGEKGRIQERCRRTLGEDAEKRPSPTPCAWVDDET